MRMIQAVPGLLSDMTGAFRRILRQPIPTAVATLSIALGLAAGAGLTSLLDGFGFRPLAVVDPDRLVKIQASTPGESRGAFTWDDLVDIRAVDTAFGDVAGWQTRGAALTPPGEAPQIVWLGVTSSNYFRTLGVRPLAGRELADSDDAPGAAPVAYLSHRLWTRLFQAKPEAIGATLPLNGTPFAIVGILPAEFTGLDLVAAADVWVPAGTWARLFGSRRVSSPALAGSLDRAWSLVARLRPTTTVANANDALQGVLPRLSERLAAGAPVPRLTVMDLQDARLGGLVIVRSIAWALVGLVNLVACANVIGLILSQAEARRRELAIRTALGAGQWQLVWNLLAESLALVALAGLAGIALAWWLIAALPALLPPSPMPLGFEFRFDLRVVLTTVGTALLAFFVIALWPALRVFRRPVAPRFGRSQDGPAGLRWLSTRHALVTAQIAVSSALLFTGGLLMRGLGQSGAVPAGFERQPMLITTIVPGMNGASAAEIRSFLHVLQDRLETTDGVVSVAFARSVPLSLIGGGGTRDVEVVGRPDTAAKPLKVRFNAVSDHYFETMGTRVVRGRPIVRADGPGAPAVVVVNRTFERMFWPDESAIGRALRIDGLGHAEIVGVAENGKYNRLSEPDQPYLFLAADQTTIGEMTLIVRTAGKPAALGSAVRAVLRDLDPTLPVLQMLTLDEHLSLSTFDLQVSETVVGFLGGAGLLLSSAGLYAVIAFGVARRRREFAIRLALGAKPSHVRAQVVRHAAALALAGLAIGTPLAITVASGFATSLYGVRPTDGLTIALVVPMVLAVTLLAVWSPARRAMRTDPAVVLKDE